MYDPFEDDDGDDLDVELTPEDIARIQAKIEAKRFEPIEYKHKVTKKIIATVDTETDPFDVGTIPAPFCLGFDTGDRYVEFWGDDCVDQFFEYLATLDDEYIIYAHNGGKFDFHFFLKYMDVEQTPLIIGSRLTKIYFAGQEFRDSYAIIPQPLSAYQKDTTDYSLFTREKRERHKAHILEYMRGDCRYLRELIVGFHDLFGDRVTVAGAALPMLNSMHGFERIKSESLDDRFRQYYFGGRNQCFETGILRPRNIERRWKLFDRNSMYPAEMAFTKHPISARAALQTAINEDTDFAYIDAVNDGALPMRGEDGSLDFTVKRGKFHATIHEINAGLETGTLKINRVIHAWAFDRKATFYDFVMKFYDLRLVAKADLDKVLDILYKLCLNSPYGKFALNPRKFKQWALTLGDVPEPQQSPENPDGWTLSSCVGDIFIWERPSPRRNGFYNIATAASITGAARANLLRNISLAVRPIYCDTDSIICEDFKGETGHKLGQWDLEATGTLCAIAGKKLYTLIDETSPEWNEGKRAVKKASKGVRLEPQDIIDVCNGREVIYQNPVPNFRMGAEPQFIDRRIRMTV